MVQSNDKELTSYERRYLWEWLRDRVNWLYFSRVVRLSTTWFYHNWPQFNARKIGIFWMIYGKSFMKYATRYEGLRECKTTRGKYSCSRTESSINCHKRTTPTKPWQIAADLRVAVSINCWFMSAWKFAESTIKIVMSVLLFMCRRLVRYMCAASVWQHHWNEKNGSYEDLKTYM